ncbi:MAG: glycosyltransferase [Pseudomonadota bacterium]|nr:glycosyltransferase [Pseudomonadota bacterium]
MLSQPRTFFAIHCFESKCYEDSAGKLEVRDPMIQSGLLGEHTTFTFGWNEKESTDAVSQRIGLYKQQLQGEPVVIYGAGAHTTEYWQLFSELNVVALADKNPALWGSTIHGIPVVPPAEIDALAKAVIISSRAFESAILQELSILDPSLQLLPLYHGNREAKLAAWETELVERVSAFQPALLVHTPTHVNENISAECFVHLKAMLPHMKVVTIWWDYDEDNSDCGYLEYERQVLRYADLVIENSNCTRLGKLHSNLPPYEQHLKPERVIFHPTWFNVHLFKPVPYSERTLDVAVFGSKVGERGKWITFLHQEFGERFQHIGGVSGEEKQPISVEEYANTLGRAKIVVNTQTYSFRKQCKGKVRESLQSGCILLEQENEETRQFIKGEEGIFYFSTPQELASQITWLLTHPEQMERLCSQISQRFDGREMVRQWTQTILSAASLSE